ncbi:uncharacterized protein LOC127462716 [Manacus candei]|uniref:uncharacterized protein LOC127462716 n=1 Tax=Manacus candei TaxID=415023 RepID=UPI002227C488|nr:uncharacterized protein LOC127462716 [Manacus candei]XP_051627560.1 uncharacterized protein LOC127462716 [Manacus candei]
MGLTLSTSQKFVYRRLKDFVIEHGHPLDKKLAKSLARWLDHKGHQLAEDTSVEQWQAIGYSLWQDSDKGDRIAKEALITWRLVLMVLQHQMMNKNISLPKTDTERTERDTEQTETDTEQTDTQDGGRGKKPSRRIQNGVEEEGPRDHAEKRREGTPREKSAQERRRRVPLAPPSRPPPPPPDCIRDPSPSMPTSTPTSSSPTSSPDTSPSRGGRVAKDRVKAKVRTSFRQDGCAHRPHTTEAYPACHHPEPDIDLMQHSPEWQLKLPDIWRAFREEAASAKDTEFLKAFPIYVEEGRAPEWL